MTLLADQSAFRDEIAAQDDERAPTSMGMAIYRDAYRGRLLSALEVSFERTRRWVGEEAFTAAACHYILSHPPRGWTLDVFGDAFPDVLDTLFAEDGEVAELAWLEWHMQQAFAAPDQPALTASTLAQAGYREEDWEHLRFTLAPGFAIRRVRFDCRSLWETLASSDQPAPPVPLDGETGLIIWRRGLSPHYRIVDAEEACLLDMVANGQCFGELAELVQPDVLGGMFSRWIGEGQVSEAILAS